MNSLQSGGSPVPVPQPLGFEQEIFLAKKHTEETIVRAIKNQPIFYNDRSSTRMIDCHEYGSDLLIVLSSEPTTTERKTAPVSIVDAAPTENGSAERKSPSTTLESFRLTLEVYVARIINGDNSQDRPKRVPGHKLSIEDLELALVELTREQKQGRHIFPERTNIVGKQFGGLDRTKTYKFTIPRKSLVEPSGVDLVKSSLPPVRESGSGVAVSDSPEISAR